MTYNKQKLIDIALAEVGYLEKATNTDLDGKTSNAGEKNYTKYARDMDAINFYNGRKQSYAWCDVFVDWCFVQAFGKDVALALTYQPRNSDNNCGAGCKYSRNYYKNNKRLFNNPESGDQIFFYSKDKTSISHTGLVYKVDGKKVYTVEGNTSGGSSIVSNGGGVFKKSYSLTNSRIAGYGRPKYSDDKTEEPAKVVEAPKVSESASYDLGSFVSDVQRSFGAIIDGVAGSETLRKTLTISEKKNRKHAVVKHIQKRLRALGYIEVGSVDGIAGPKFTTAVKRFQTVNGCVVDGEITRREKTWRVLLGME